MLFLTKKKQKSIHKYTWLKNWTNVEGTMRRWTERTLYLSQLFPSSESVVLPHPKQAELLAEGIWGITWKRGDYKTSGADGLQRLHATCEDTRLNLIFRKTGQFQDRWEIEMQKEIILDLWGGEWSEENQTVDTEDAAFASLAHL